MWGFKLLHKCFLNRGQEAKPSSPSHVELADKSILSIPRYQRSEVYHDGKLLLIPDAPSCYYAHKEIHEKEIYQFPSDTKNPVIIDCGANIGLSILYFKKLYPDALITAIEADPVIFSILEKNIQTFGCHDVILIHKALSNKVGEVLFIQEGADAGRMPLEVENPGKSVRVTAVMLDQLLDQEVDFLKIDIEGAETDVILESKKLHLVKNLFVEYHSFVHAEQRLHQLLEKLAENGFRYYINAAFCPPKPYLSQGSYLGMDLQLNISCVRNNYRKE